HRSVTVPAEMELDDVFDLAGGGPLQDGGEELGGLGVGEVTLIAEDAGDEVVRPPAAVLQVHVVVELQPEDVHLGQVFDQGRIPGAQVGEETQRWRYPEQVARAVEAEAECGTAVVADG